MVAIPLADETPPAVLREAFAVAAGGRLVVDASAASVQIQAGPQDAVEVEVRRRGLLRPTVLEIERDGDDVFVEAHGVPLLRWLPRWAWRRVEIEVSVPQRYSVEVETHGGRVEIRDVEGEVEARSQRGPLVLRNVRGPIDARSERGSVDVSGCRGDVDVITQRGSIEIEDVEGQVCAHTERGKLAVTDVVGELLLRSRAR